MDKLPCIIGSIVPIRPTCRTKITHFSKKWCHYGEKVWTDFISNLVLLPVNQWSTHVSSAFSRSLQCDFSQTTVWFWSYKLSWAKKVARKCTEWENLSINPVIWGQWLSCKTSYYGIIMFQQPVMFWVYLQFILPIWHTLCLCLVMLYRRQAHTPVSLLMMLKWAAGSCRIPPSRPQTDKSPIMLQICMDWKQTCNTYGKNLNRSMNYVCVWVCVKGREGGRAGKRALIWCC